MAGGGGSPGPHAPVLSAARSPPPVTWGPRCARASTRRCGSWQATCVSTKVRAHGENVTRRITEGPVAATERAVTMTGLWDRVLLSSSPHGQDAARVRPVSPRGFSEELLG